ncbi:MAG TPA: hypothetical protein VHO46_02290 [Bacteroidales bacterium]|nr:hypothetical protein [Bacteroidales bacterium]
MRTIIDNAESVLQEGMERANEQIRMKSLRMPDNQHAPFSLQSFALHEARSNPDFFKWLFDDPEISFFGTSLSEAQKKEYYTWLHDL